MNTDQLSRLKRSVLVSLVKKDGVLCVQLDDVELISRSQPSSWKFADFITLKQVEGQALEELEFNEKELADLGYYILARLRAIKKVDKDFL